MGRNRKSAMAAGSDFEKQVADYLAEHVDDRIERRTRNGVKDRGDIASLRLRGERVVVECKEYNGQLSLPQWTKEAEIERGNDDALVGIVVAKRRGTRKPEEQWVAMTLGEFVAIVNGNRDHLD